MRRFDREVTDGAAMERVLRSAWVCRLGMVDRAGPYVVPVCFGYEDLRIFIHGADSGRKMDCIRANPHVAFEVTDEVRLIDGPSACDYGMQFQCVMGTGLVEILKTDSDRSRGLDCIMRKYSRLPSYSYRESAFSRTVVLAIAVETMTMKACGP